MEYKLIGTGLGRRLLDVHGRRDDDGTLAVVKRLLLLIGKEIAQQEDEEETDTAKEADLAHQDVRTEKIEQHKQQRHDDGDDASLRPVIYTREVDQRLIPGNEEHFAYRGNLVDGLASRKLEIEVDVLISRREQAGTLIVEHRLGNIICTIVGIAEVVVNLGRGTILEQLFIVADSLLVVALLVFRIGIVLGDCRYRRSAEAQHR